jgi:uncharacterized protein DUF2865
LRRVAFRRVGALPFAITALAALIGTAVIAAPAEVMRSSSGASLDAAIASKVQQLAALKRNITESDCDYAVDAAIIEGCDQLTAQAQSLAAEIDALKAEASEASLAKASSRPMSYSFKTRTNPNMSYRTFCVRECDGFYYPLSEASTPGSFLADGAKCQSSCSSPAKLFYSALPGGDAGAMVALTGERYGEIANAFRYRSEYVEGCACKPKPWSAEAKVMFDRRAVLATRTPNEKIVAAGAGEVVKLLGAGEAKVAVRATRAKPRYAQAMIERPRFLPFLRPFRYASAASQAAAEPLPQHRFFLFRERY